MPEPKYAPVPAADCGDPEACPELLPEGATLDVELTVAPENTPEVRGLLDQLFAQYRLPTGRLVRRPGLFLFDDPDGRQWLAVDYLVPGVRGDTTPGWQVDLNRENRRAAADAPGADEPALDRWVVEVDRPLPAWLIPADTRTADRRSPTS